MGNTPSQKSKVVSTTLKSQDSFQTENLTEGENSSTLESTNPTTTPMKALGKKPESGTTSKMPNYKKTTATGTPRSSAVAKNVKMGGVEHRDDSLPQRSIIRDDQVQVNLAMADLMAYLQVVANNSNNLPLTRRDDPELTRMVSTLSSEEYARKSAAFIPADVRVVGGSFLKYGKVWDLPTSEEFTALDGAQEPGK
jgi:hypothetical protein